MSFLLPLHPNKSYLNKQDDADHSKYAVCREIVLVPSMLPIIIDCIAKVVQAIDKDFNQTTADHFTYNS